MAKVQVQLGSAARKELFFALDSASTTGAGKTGASGTMVAYYVRNETTPAATSIATPSFTEVSSANMPGVYYLTVPVGAFATGATTCVVMITGTGIAPVTMEYQLVAYNPDSATNLGLSALPTATHSTAGGLITSGSGTAQLTTTSGVVTANTTQWGGTAVTGMPLPTASYTAPLTTTGTAQAVWNAVVHDYDATSSNTTGTFGKAIVRSDAQAKNGDVTMYSVSGTNGIDVDIHRIANDQTAATNLKALLLNTSTITLGGQFDTTGNTAITKSVWNQARSTASAGGGVPTAGTFGYYLDQQVSTVGGGSAPTAADIWAYGTRSLTGSVTVSSINADVVNASALAADATAEIADRVLGRTISGGADGGRTVTSALRILRNKFTAASTTLTVYAEDDATTAWTSTLSTDAAATPITGSDPA